jgi:hypothetical protein
MEKCFSARSARRMASQHCPRDSRRGYIQPLKTGRRKSAKTLFHRVCGFAMKHKVGRPPASGGEPDIGDLLLAGPFGRMRAMCRRSPPCCSRAGAMGYLIKGMTYDVLVQAMLRVHHGNRFLPPPVTRTLSQRLPDSDLSHREREVLRLIVAGKSNREIGE